VLARLCNYRGAVAIQMALLAKGYKEAAVLFTTYGPHAESDRLFDEAIRRRDGKIAAQLRT
jgi:hypothetical protein